MKPLSYIITFKNGKTVFVKSFSKEAAVILAQAVMIKNGLDYEYESIRRIAPKSEQDFERILSVDFTA
jgi:hypothetical protein